MHNKKSTNNKTKAAGNPNSPTALEQVVMELYGEHDV